jgi:glycine cleavage system H protein
MSQSPHTVLELTVHKFIFRFPNDVFYSEAGIWIRQENGNLLRLGISDFTQQRSGDIAFANLTGAGTALEVDDEIATIETVKINVSLPSPVKGKIIEINPGLQDSPEWINQDPYGKGWMVLIEPADVNWPPPGTLNAENYLELARTQAEAELRS